MTNATTDEKNTVIQALVEAVQTLTEQLERVTDENAELQAMLMEELEK